MCVYTSMISNGVDENIWACVQSSLSPDRRDSYHHIIFLPFQNEKEKTKIVSPLLSLFFYKQLNFIGFDYSCVNRVVEVTPIVA